MTTKASLKEAEWNLLKTSPQWIEAMLTSYRTGGGGLVGKRYEHILDKVLSAYKTNNKLVKEVLDFNEDPKIDGSTTQDQAKKKLDEIGSLLEDEVDESDAAAFRKFLLDIGQNFAKETSEGLFGLGKDVSKKETAILETIKTALKATDADAKRRAKEDRQEAKAKADAAQEAKQRREAEAKAKAEAEAKAKAAEEARQKKEAEAKAKALAETKAKIAEAERQKKEAEAKAKAEAEKKREAEKAKAAQSAPKAEPAKAPPPAQPAAATKSAERIYEVKSGDSLSKIALEIYGDASRWPEIFEANKDQIKDPNLIYPGQKFRIP